MFHYFNDYENFTNYNKRFEIIFKKRNIQLNIDDGFLKVINKEYEQNYLLYYENFLKPSFIISNIDLQDNKDEDEKVKSIYEEINNKIDEYDSVEQVILEIYDKITKYNKEKVLLEKKKAELSYKINKKNSLEFEKELDEKKILYLNKNYDKNNKVNTGIFSLRSNIEMLGDQILKIHNDSRFNVIIEDFPKIKVFMSDFNFIGSSDLIVEIDIDMSCLNLLSTPPKISISSNKVLKDNIIKVISELKPFSDIKSWSIKYSLSDTIFNIHNMINTYGETEQEFSSEFDKIINDLEYLVSIKNKNISETKLLELFDKDLIKSKINDETNKTKQSKSNNAYWKKGTGYGNEKTKEWDIEEYIKSVNEKKNKILLKFNYFISYLSDNYKDENKLNSMSESLINRIVNLLINYLQNEEITKENSIKICNLIYNNFKTFSSNKIEKFNNLLKLLKNYVEENEIDTILFNSNNEKKDLKTQIEKITSISNDTKLDEFSKIFDSYGFKMYADEFSGFYYKETVNINSDKLTRLKKEFNILKKSIRINSEASMFFWIEKNKLEKMRFIITGPSDTPYDQGLYIFDMTLSSEFPYKPPLVHFSNNGGMRFNPNLYNSGKVCLSLLGTWRGDKGESWNSATSTFFQILVSIQSQILIEEPFFNEPGYEKQIGKEQGKKNSKEYNDNIRQYNLDYAMNGLIENVLNSKSDYAEFEYIIRNYFKYKKDRIINILNKWENEYDNDIKKNAFTKSKNKFIELSNKL